MQVEDGIRGLVRFRELGDVYKQQDLGSVFPQSSVLALFVHPSSVQGDAFVRKSHQHSVKMKEIPKHIQIRETHMSYLLISQRLAVCVCVVWACWAVAYPHLTLPLYFLLSHSMLSCSVSP